MLNKKLDWFWNNNAVAFPDNLNLLAYWDNSTEYMASDGTSWTDRIGGFNFVSSGTGHSRATGINSRPKMVNTVSGFWTRNIVGLNGVSAFTIWSVGKRHSFENYTDGNNRTSFLQASDNRFYGFINNAGLKYGSVASTNTEHYAVCVFDGSGVDNAARLKIWVNGVAQTLTFVNSIPSVTESSATTSRIGWVGGSAQASETYEIGIVNRAITTDEVSELNTFLAIRYAL